MSRHHRRLSWWRWEPVQRQALDRDNWRCVQCGGVDGLEVDHVVPLDKGGAALDLGNLQTLCRGCHIDKTDAEAGRDPERREWRRFVREG